MRFFKFLHIDKKIISVFFIGATLSILPTSVGAAVTIFERVHSKNILNGLTYEERSRVTDEGLLYIHTLKVDLTRPYLSLRPVYEQDDYGLKVRTSTLLEKTGALAGVNADFFGMTGQYSASFGPIIKDGDLISVSSLINKEANGFASFYLNENNSPFITYITSDIEFLNDGKKNIEVYAINKITDMVMPIIITDKAFNSTADIDSRFDNLVKVVVEDGFITYISEKGETVLIPDGGYALVMSSVTADGYYNVFKQGQSASLKVNAPIDINNMSTGIGGGARVLLNGELANDSNSIIKGRQPRTAIGINKEKNELYMVVIDGRGQSIGATHEELAEILLNLGAYDAMHFDGGGSSTMVLKDDKDDKVNVVNTPSDGAERKVINSFGIFDDSEMGEIVDIQAEIDKEFLFNGVPALVSVYGLDDKGHRKLLDNAELNFEIDSERGIFLDNALLPKATGSTEVIVKYGDFMTSSTINVKELTELRFTKEIKNSVGDIFDLNLIGAAENGQQNIIDLGINYEVIPDNLGEVVDDGVFISKTSGAGYIKATILDVTAYTPVYIGGREELITSFEQDISGLNFTAYPDIVEGSISIDESTAAQGSRSLALNYSFPKSDMTEAAYINYTDGLLLQGDPRAIKISVYGDSSNKWLRMRLLDANDKEHILDIVKNLDFVGFKQFTTNLPDAVAYPVRISRVYLASTDNQSDSQGTIYIDNILAVYNDEFEEIVLPESKKFTDNLLKGLDDSKIENDFDIAILGKIEQDSDAYKSIATTMWHNFIKGTDQAVFTNEVTYPNDMNIPFTQWSSSYYAIGVNNVSIIKASASNGYFWSTTPAVWTKLNEDINNSGSKHVLFITDIDILGDEGNKEFELLKTELIKFSDAGKNVFVISTGANTTSTNIVSGIRFINVADLFNNEILNKDFRIVRFRINGDSIYYDLQKAF